MRWKKTFSHLDYNYYGRFPGVSNDKSVGLHESKEILRLAIFFHKHFPSLCFVVSGRMRFGIDDIHTWRGGQHHYESIFLVIRGVIRLCWYATQSGFFLITRFDSILFAVTTQFDYNRNIFHHVIKYESFIKFERRWPSITL